MAEETKEKQVLENQTEEFMDDQWTEEADNATREETEQSSPEEQQQETSETGAEAEPEIQKAEFEDFKSDSAQNDPPGRRIEMLLDVMLPVNIELGRTKMYIKEILELERGSIVELDKLAGEPVELYINNKKMAEGEVVVVDKHFGIRITNLDEPADRLKTLGSE